MGARWCSRLGCGLGVVATTVAAACSSVPDVAYDDADAASGGDAGKDAGKDAASSGDAARDARATCSNPPSDSMCCGDLLCVGCSKNQDCKECEDKCKVGEVCCNKGGPLRCLPSGAACN